MHTKNDITGNSLVTRVSTQQYRDNYDLIFSIKKEKPEDEQVLTEVTITKERSGGEFTLSTGSLIVQPDTPTQQD
jgi:hypothetical protein